MMTTYDEFIERLEAAGWTLYESGDGFVTHCPYSAQHSNGDASPSFWIRPKDGGADVFTGCICDMGGPEHFAERMERLREGPPSVPPADGPVRKPGGRQHVAMREVERYSYGDGIVKVRFHVLNPDTGQDWLMPDGKVMKSFAWLGLNGRVLPPLYRQDEFVAAGGGYLVESERSADLLWSLSKSATTFPPRWEAENIAVLRSLRVVVLPDNDDAGQKKVARLPFPLPVVELPGLGHRQGPDDWLRNGGTVEKLQELALKAAAPVRRLKATMTIRPAFDAVRADDLGEADERPEPIVEDLLYDGQVLFPCAEEGVGKSWMAWQMSGEMTGPVDRLVLGHFAHQPVRRVLYIDTEQSEDDAMLIRDEMVRRGVLDPSRVWWVDAVGRDFGGSADDRKWLTDEVDGLRPDILIIDTGTSAVAKPKDDEAVKPLFNLLAALMRSHGVRAVVMFGQPRKRGGSDVGPRQFDDLFGSREWKGRPSTVLWLTESHIKVWKQRGGYLRKRWGKHHYAKLVRVGYDSPWGAPLVVRTADADQETEERRERILKVVEKEPDRWSKTSLLKDRLDVSHGEDYTKWSIAVSNLIGEGRLIQKGGHHRLSVPQPDIDF